MQNQQKYFILQISQWESAQVMKILWLPLWVSIIIIIVIVYYFIIIVYYFITIIIIIVVTPGPF